MISRSAEARIVDKESNSVLSTHIIPYGSSILITKGNIKKGDKICEWDPYNAVIISEVAGKVEFDDIVEGVSYRTESDEQTGYQEKVIIDSRNKKMSPTITISKKTYTLPVGSHLAVEDKDKNNIGTIESGKNVEIKIGNSLELKDIPPGTSLHIVELIPGNGAKLARSAGSSGDITGGLPRVTEMFEARNPSNPAVVSEIDGSVSFGKIKRGNREIIITSKTGEEKKY